MKVLLTTLHAKYFHTSLALRSLKAFCPQFGEHLKIAEYTINQQEDYIAASIYKESPDVVCFSCYIWNITMTLNIVKCLKITMPHVIIMLGGPEVSFNAESVMEQSGADIIVKGEAEEVFAAVLERLITKKEAVCGIFEPQSFVPLDSIPFVYGENDIEALSGKIIYYETSRGCPYKCQYCLSGGEGGVRFLSLERCFGDLSFLIKRNVKQVKFVDRTFNADRKRANAIFSYIIKNNNGYTNFHFEMSGDLLDDETIELLSGAPKGLIQFEIGVQSTNAETLNAIERKTNTTELFSNIKKLQLKTGINIHLDLIAGLPYENFTIFGKSFDDVYRLTPDMLQLGFLKLLHGSGLRLQKHKYGILHKENPPYTVLSTNYISYNDILTLKTIEEIVEMYYNAYKCVNTFKYISAFFESPFDFYLKFAYYYEENHYDAISLSVLVQHKIVFDFCALYVGGHLDQIKNLLVFDLLCNDRNSNLPEWAHITQSESDERFKKKAAMGKSKSRYVHKFEYDVAGFSKGGELTRRDNFVLFQYAQGKGNNSQGEVTP